jgi:hypothetical protein
MEQATVLVHVIVCDACASCDQELESVPGAVEESGFHRLSVAAFSNVNF